MTLGTHHWPLSAHPKKFLVEKNKAVPTGQPGFDGWVDHSRFYVLFSSISAISGRWADDNERLCGMEPR